MKNAALIILVLFFLTCPVSAGEYNFETTAQGIEKALTQPRPTKKIRTRGIKTRGFKPVKTRGIRVVEEEEGKIVEKTVMVVENQSTQGVNLKIEFDLESYTIRRESVSLLDELGKALTGDKLEGKNIFIKGHTDSDGSDNYNLKLSLNRGLSVKQYLIANFEIAPTRLKVVGYGESMPLVPNTSNAKKQLNRRVEIETDSTP
jgi:outer membrane protein OmpA-like peptidoglycan-associated protein